MVCVMRENSKRAPKVKHAAVACVNWNTAARAALLYSNYKSLGLDVGKEAGCRLGGSSVVRHVISMSRALGSIPSTAQIKKGGRGLDRWLSR